MRKHQPSPHQLTVTHSLTLTHTYTHFLTFHLSILFCRFLLPPHSISPGRDHRYICHCDVPHLVRLASLIIIITILTTITTTTSFSCLISLYTLSSLLPCDWCCVACPQMLVAASDLAALFLGERCLNTAQRQQRSHHDSLYFFCRIMSEFVLSPHLSVSQIF